MCCWTHTERDRQDAKNKLSFTLAEGDDERCRCTHPGEPCRRRITQEDWLCDWCRGRNHYEECYKMEASPS